MTRDELFDYLLNTYNVLPEFMWKKHPKYAVFRHPENKKWFALVMNVDPLKVGISNSQVGISNSPDNEIEVLDVKMDPEKISLLQKAAGFKPAYHMNKEHWISIILDQFTLEKIIPLIADSFQLTE